MGLMEIFNKVAIVTGASAGIGLETAKALGKFGTKVALVARTKHKLVKLAQEIPGSEVFVTDISIENDVRKMVTDVANHYGRIDILVNNAGVGYISSIEDIDTKKLRTLFDVNVVGPLIAMQAVIPYLRAQREGAIVNISSGTSYMYLPYLGAYSSLKRALNGISLTAREELAKDNINVSVVYPYITNTDFNDNSMRNENSKGTLAISKNEPRPEADSPEFVALKILEAIKTGKPEIRVRD